MSHSVYHGLSSDARFNESCFSCAKEENCVDKIMTGNVECSQQHRNRETAKVIILY